MVRPDMEPTPTVTPSSDLGTQPILRLFWRYTIPAVAAMIINGIYVLIDGIFIGRVVGAEGLAALNFAWPVIGIIIGVGIMIGMGTGTWISISRGQNDHHQPRRCIGNALLLLLAFGLLFPLLFLPTGKRVLTLLGASGLTHELATDYLAILVVGSIATLAGAALPLMVRNDERPQLTTVIMVTGAVLNIVLDWLFIVVMGLEAAGAAMATVLASAAVGLWGIAYFLSHKASTRISFADLHFSWSCTIRTLSVGLPGLFMFLYYGFVLATHNRLLMNYGGVVAVGAFTIVGYVQAIYYMFSEGVAAGIQPLVSYNHGAGNHQRLLTTLRTGLGTVLSIGIGSVLLINWFPEAITFIFNKNDAALQGMTVTALHLHLFSMFLDGFIVLTAAWFQAMARSRIASWITAANMLIQIPLLLVLPPLMGIAGILIALPVSNVILAIPVAWMLRVDLRALKHSPSCSASGSLPARPEVQDDE